VFCSSTQAKHQLEELERFEAEVRAEIEAAAAKGDRSEL
jgi:hypothetical protein